MRTINTICVLLAILLTVSLECSKQSWGGPLEEKLMSEFQSLYPESGQSRDATLKQIKELVDHKADVNVRNAKGDTLLITATLRGDLEMAKLLIQGGADVNLKSSEDGLTPLMVAVYNGDMKMIDLLLKNKADVNATNPGGQTALFMAIERGNLAATIILLKNGAEVNHQDPKSGLTPLLLASTLGDLAMTKVLVGAKADINNADAKGDTPLMIASASGDKELVSWLLEHGAKIDVKGGAKVLRR